MNHDIEGATWGRPAPRQNTGIFTFPTLAIAFGLLAAGCGGGDAAGTDGDADGDQSVSPSPTIFSAYTPDEKTVAFVDLDRYLGIWYEIATDLIPFQRDCTGSTATYEPGDEPDTVKVINECFLENLEGEYYRREARAEIINTETNAELLVYFSESFGADYWVIELDGQQGDQPYEWAVVGSFFDIYLWVLSRDPVMEPDRLQRILARLEQRGYDLDKLSFTTQPSE